VALKKCRAWANGGHGPKSFLNVPVAGPRPIATEWSEDKVPEGAE